MYFYSKRTEKNNIILIIYDYNQKESIELLPVTINGGKNRENEPTPGKVEKKVKPDPK